MSNTDSPWKTAADAGAYLGGRSKRFVHREIKAARLRAAKIGGRGEILTRAEWLDEWIEDQAKPILVTARKRSA